MGTSMGLNAVQPPGPFFRQISGHGEKPNCRGTCRPRAVAFHSVSPNPKFLLFMVSCQGAWKNQPRRIRPAPCSPCREEQTGNRAFASSQCLVLEGRWRRVCSAMPAGLGGKPEMGDLIGQVLKDHEECGRQMAEEGQRWRTGVINEGNMCSVSV